MSLGSQSVASSGQLHSVPRAELLGLLDDGDSFGKSRNDCISLVAHDDKHLSRIEFRNRVNDPPHHWLAGELIQHLGQRRLHARALSRSKDYDSEAHLVPSERRGWGDRTRTRTKGTKTLRATSYTTPQ